MATTITANGINFPDGSASAPSIGGTDTNTGLFTGSDIVGFATGGVERIKIDAQGDIFIGTTSDIAPANGTNLCVSDGTISRLILEKQSTIKFGLNVSNGFSIYDETNDAQRFGIDSNGNVSIGNNPTTHADYILHIEDSGETNIKVEGSTSTLGARISLQNNDTTANAYSQYSFNDAGGQSTSAIQGINTDQTNNYGELAFLTRNAQGSPPSERVRIDKDGKVGIGTSNPNAKLTVNGDLFFGGTASVEAGSSTGSLTLVGGSTYKGGRIVLSGGSSDSDIKFTTSGASITNTERMRIRSDGKLQIGTAGGNATYLANAGNAAMDLWGDGSEYPTLRLGTEVYNSVGEDIRFGRPDHGAADIRYHSLKSLHGDSAANNYLEFFLHDFGSSPFTSQKSAFKINGLGNAIIPDGDLVIGTAGHGIDFSATSDASSTGVSELLSDYEEGIHLVTDPGGNWTIGNSGSYRHISYVKIGNLCTVNGQIYCGAGSGAIKFSLPFAAIANQTVGGNAADLGYGNGAVRLYGWDIPSNAFSVTMQMVDGNSHSTLDITYDNANSGYLEGDNGSYVSYTLTYRTA